MKYLLIAICLMMAGMSACRFSTGSKQHASEDQSEMAKDNEDQAGDDKDEPRVKDEDKDKEDQDEVLQGKDINSLLNKSGSNKHKSTIPLDQLKELLPIQMDGMIRSNLNADHAGALGFKLSTVKADFKKGNRDLRVEIIDFGGLTSLVSSIADWTDSDLVHEDEKGTAKIDSWHGYKAFEKDDIGEHESSLAFIYKNKLIINLKGDQLTLNDLKDLAEKNLLNKLDKIKIEHAEQ